MGALFLPAFASIFLGIVLLFFSRIRQKGSVMVRYGRGTANIQGTFPFVLIVLGILIWALDAMIPAV